MGFKILFKKYTKEDSEIWEEINYKAGNSTFLTNGDWIDFKSKYGVTQDRFIIHFELGQSDFPIGILYIERFERKVAKFAYAPYNPVVSFSKLIEEFEITNEGKFYEEFFVALKSFMTDYNKKHGLNLFRFDPFLDRRYRQMLEKIGFKKSLAPAQAMDTWVSDITASEDKILMGMKKDTRYYINRAKNLGVSIERATTLSHVKEFGKLMKDVTTRKGFLNYDSDYYVKQWQELNKKGLTEVYLAKYKDKYISGALINLYRDTAYYSHGASSSDPEMMKLSSPYLLHFEIIKDVKQKGIRKYNFWGAVPKEYQNHVWRGISDFKMKFPGEMVNLVGAYELPGNKFGYLKQRVSDRFAYKKERY